MDKVTVSIKRRNDCADIPLPSYETSGSVGMDLAAAVDGDVVIGSGERNLIPCGFFLALPPGYEAQVRPRSGLAVRHGLSLVNTPGTIDSDYRGEVKVPVINHGAEPFTVKRGMRIAQMIVTPVPKVELVEVTELPETARGEGGFGHTGL
jgi:dUTP pyrophosphatase